MIVLINIRWQDRTIDYSMDLDSNCPTDYAVLHYLDRGQPCEPECVHVMLRALKEGDIAVDGGANIGFFTLLMSKLVGATGQVFAFEPGLANMEKLKANIALNECHNVLVIEQALWREDAAEVLFHVYADGGRNSIEPFNVDDVPCKVSAVALDSELAGRKARLIKLDIEGSELEALKGAAWQLHNGAIVLTELNEPALERAGASVQKLRNFFLLDDKDCFKLSMTGDFPTCIPWGVKMVIARQNTNVMFCEMRQIKELWPELHL